MRGAAGRLSRRAPPPFGVLPGAGGRRRARAPRGGARAGALGLAALLVLLVGAGCYGWWARAPRPGGSPRSEFKLFSVVTSAPPNAGSGAGGGWRGLSEGVRRPELCEGVAPSLRGSLPELVSRSAAAVGALAAARGRSVPAGVGAAWDYALGFVPGLELHARLVKAIPPSLLRTDRARNAVSGSGVVEPWAIDYLRADLARFREGLPDYPASGYSGRGVVLTGGGVRHFGGALVVFATLRKQGCHLPGELWVTEAERREIPAPVVEALEGHLGAAVRVIPEAGPSGTKRDAGKLEKNFQAKVAALVHSSFQEVLFLDSDNIPITNACEMFDEGGYRETGTMFWRDLWPASPAVDLQAISGTKAPLDVTHESGQILLDKERGWRPLMVAAYFNLLGPALYYRLLSEELGDGDKETFAHAFLTENLPEYTVPQDVGGAGADGAHGDSSVVRYAMLQRRPSGEPLFLHQNLRKTMFFGLPLRAPLEEGPHQRKLGPMHEEGREDDDFDELAGYNIENWVWKVLRTVRCDAGVVRAVLELPEFDDLECHIPSMGGRHYMRNVPHRDKLLCTAPYEQSEWDVRHGRPARSSEMPPPPSLFGDPLDMADWDP